MLVKLLRILNLLPIVVVVGLLVSKQNRLENVQRTQVLPTFLVAFVIVAGLNLLVTLPPAFVNSVKELSSQLILVSIVAIGLKTDVKQLFSVGYQPLLLIVFETAFLLFMVITAIFLAASLGW